MNRIVFLLLFCLPILAASRTGLAADSVTNPAHFAVPGKILLLPPQLFVGELSAGGIIQRQADWGRQSTQNMLDAIEQISSEKHFKPIHLAPATPAEDLRLEPYYDLLDRVASSIFIYGRGKDHAWDHLQSGWGFTMGSGLSDLASQTGADAALFVSGIDLISSEGRKLAFMAGLVTGLIMPLGQSFLAVALVDLHTGDILWIAYDQSMTLDTRDPAGAGKMVASMFKDYPQP